jgi:hypothetical protein
MHVQCPLLVAPPSHWQHVLWPSCLSLRVACCVDGQRAGGSEVLKRVSKSGQMTVDEARKVLGVGQGATWEVVEQVCQLKCS